jgi:hypothetical protein
MSNLKFNFAPDTYALAEEINQNFERLENQDKWGINLTSQINGSTIIFTTPNNFYPNSLRVFLDGLRLIPGVDYTETGVNQFTLNIDAPEVGANIIVDYRLLY